MARVLVALAVARAERVMGSSIVVDGLFSGLRFGIVLG